MSFLLIFLKAYANNPASHTQVRDRPQTQKADDPMQPGRRAHPSIFAFWAIPC